MRMSTAMLAFCAGVLTPSLDALADFRTEDAQPVSNPFASTAKASFGVLRWFPGDMPSINACLSSARHETRLPVGPDAACPVVLLAGDDSIPLDHSDVEVMLQIRTVSGALLPTRICCDESEPNAACWHLVLNRDLPDGRYQVMVAVTDPALASALAGEPRRARYAVPLTIDKGGPRSLEEKLYLHWRRGQLAERRDDWGTAFVEANAVLALYSSSIDAQLMRIKALSRLGRETEARTALSNTREALRQGPKDRYVAWQEFMGGVTTAASLDAWATEEAGIAPNR